VVAEQHHEAAEAAHDGETDPAHGQALLVAT
jgi:hypothetical protein